jgi:hypothetical protein
VCGDCRVMPRNWPRTREIPPVGRAGEEGRTDDDLVGVALGRVPIVLGALPGRKM